MLYKEEITFLEKPASKDELLIAESMKKYFEAMRKHDLGLLLSLFGEDASIDSRLARRIVSRGEYGKAMERGLPFMSNISLSDLIIRIRSPEEAVVFGFSQYTYRGVVGAKRERIWKFKKNGAGQWLIVESRYYS